MHLHAALITVLNILIIAAAMWLVGRARGKYGIHAPATTGNADFERVFRAHQNTLEQTIMFLPVLWLASIHGNEKYAAWLGYAWLLSRAWYVFGYVRPGGRRGGGFIVALAAWFGLLVMSLYALLPALIA